MYVVIAGCGRVGSGLARSSSARATRSAVIDENPDAFDAARRRLPGPVRRSARRSTGRCCARPASSEADAFVAATDGDNTNIVSAQIAAGAVRRAVRAWRVSSTRCGPSCSTAAASAPSVRPRTPRTCCTRPSTPARSRRADGDVRRHRRRRQGRASTPPAACAIWGTRSSSSSSASTRYDLLLEELDECLMLGDGTEIWVLEKAGIARADMVVAVTGDDEDNIIISQIAKLKYAVPKVVARVNNPFNQPTFDLLGDRRHGLRGHPACCAHPARAAGAQVRAAAHVQAREHRARRARGGGDVAVRQQACRGHLAARGRAAHGHSARRHGAVARAARPRSCRATTCSACSSPARRPS